MAGVNDLPKRVNCFVCGKEKLTRNEIGLNKKFLGTKVEKFHCIECLAEFLEMSPDELSEAVQNFKDSGCELFV